MEPSVEQEILTRLERLEKMLKQNVLMQKQVLNMEEAAEYLNLSVSYLYKLTSQKHIPHYKPDGKIIHFDRNALDEWQRRNPVKTENEINVLADRTLRRKKLRHENGEMPLHDASQNATC